MTHKEIINWLLEGDVSIQYQVHRDLLDEICPDLRERIEYEGWGHDFLAERRENGHWGRGFYQPKWTSSHYTLLDLRNLEILPGCKPVHDTLEMIMRDKKAPDGGIDPSRTIGKSDVCINGMALNYFAYFGWDAADLESIVDFVLSQKMADGGFNCRSNRSGARHSSLHTTLSVAEGIREYERHNYTYRLDELLEAEMDSREFILQHRLYRSDKTGRIIDRRMLALTWPSRWRYDILRALDYFQYAGVEYDERMEDAIEVLLKKRREDGTWNLQAKHPGAQHFEMEKGGQPSRWNTLRVLRAFRHFDIPLD
jgi:hypothetical protein